MVESYLDGKISISSLAVPTVEDLRTIHALTPEEYRQFEAEVMERARKSPINNATLEDAWNIGKARAAARTD